MIVARSVLVLLFAAQATLQGVLSGSQLPRFADGWSASIAAPAAQRIGQPIDVKITLTNVSSRDAYVVAPDRVCSYRLRAETKPGFGQESFTRCDGTRVNIPIGTARTFDVDASTLLNADYPGAYTVVLRGFDVCPHATGLCGESILLSNPIELQVLADDADLGPSNEGWAASVVVTPARAGASVPRIAHVHIKNVSNAAQQFPDVGPCDLRVIVTAAVSGKVWASRGRCTDIYHISPRTIAPGASADYAFDVHRIAPLDTPGRYYVLLAGLWTDHYIGLTSNSALVEVTGP